MEKIVIEINKDDEEMINVIKDLQCDATFIEPKSFEGLEAVIQIVVPLSVVIIEILYTHLANRKTDSEKDLKRTKKRVIITKRTKIDIEGYSKDEVIELLERITEWRNND